MWEKAPGVMHITRGVRIEKSKMVNRKRNWNDGIVVTNNQ